jgi:putative membrane protein
MPIRAILGQAARGALMGTADIVPGVSGGTVALVLGIWERLIANIHAGARVLGVLVRGRFREVLPALQRLEWVWVLSLLAGLLLAVVLMSSVIERLLRDAPIQVAALMFGLVAGSVVVAWRMLRRRDVGAVAIAAVVAVITFLLLGLRADVHPTGGATDLAWWAFLGSGALAICAMILPGISGSFVLVLLGTYGAVLAAVNARDLLSVGLVTIGCVLGLALFSTFLNWMLREHHDRVVALMVGLLLGSMRVLWPWPGGVETTVLGTPDRLIPLAGLLAVAGLAVVLVIEWAARPRGTAAATA